MATEVASILVPRADDAGDQQHTPTAAHAALSSPTPLSPMLSPKLPKPTDPADLAAAIRKQVEFYFSDANLPTDKHLLKVISKDPEGYVPLKMIANFKRVKGLTKELSVVTEALKGSSMLSVDEEGSRVRRTTPLPAYDTSDICRRTVVAEHLPDKPTIESVTQLFAQYGEIVMVRICSRGSTGKLPAWLNKAVEAINMGVGHGEFALVEFGSEEECVHCVAKTKNPDNWRTSLRVRHLLPNFKAAGKSKGGRSSETGEGSHGGSHGGHQQHHAHSSHTSSGGGGRRSMDAGPGLVAPTPGAYQPPPRRSLEFLHPPQQQHQHTGELSFAAPASSSSGAQEAAASAAASAATAGLPVHLAPIRTQPTSSGGGSRAGSSAGGIATAAGRLPGSPSAGWPGSPIKVGGVPSPIKVGSPMKGHLAGIGGSIGSPRTVKSPAPPEVASLIDTILSAPTGGTPTRDGRNSGSGRWSSGSGLGIDVDRAGAIYGAPEASPAVASAAASAALAGVMTPPQASSPRASTSSTAGGARESVPGGLRTPTRMSAAGAAAAAAAAGSSSGGAYSPVPSPMNAHLAAQAAAAASCAMTSSPKASSTGNWRSGNTPTSSMPGTPLGGTCVLSISAGAAVGAALDACSPPPGATGAFTVGSPNLSGGGAGRPAPWVSSSRLAHQQRMAAGGGSDGGVAAARSGTPDADDSWRSGASNRPPRGPRTSMPSSGGGSSGGGGRQRRKSWHATEAEEAAIAVGASPAASVAATADGSTSDSSTSMRKSGRQVSRLGQAGDYQATIEAIREASCELDSGAVGRAIAALSISGRKKGSGGGSSAEGVISPEGDAAGDGEHGKRRRARHRRSRSSGSRRQSLDDARPHVFSEMPASAGVGAVGLSPRAAIRHGALAPDEAHHRHDKHSSSGGGSGGEHHHGLSGHGGARASGAGAHDSSSGGKKKKDYAAWAAATPEFRAVATAAKHSSGGGSGGSAAVLSTSPVRSTGISPMRGQAGGFVAPLAAPRSAAQAPGSLLPGHAHHQEHTARGPDGTRGFAMGRGRPLTPAAP